MMKRQPTIPAFLAALLLALAGLPAVATAADVEVPELEDLEQDARIMRKREMPMMLVFSAQFCEYCRLVESDFLEPMILSGEYEDRILIRETTTDGHGLIHDLDGETITPDDLADRYNAWMTPVVVFIDAEGEEVAERVVGMTNYDFYGGFLDKGIDRAVACVKGEIDAPECR